MVDPVVVIPDMLSKKESVALKFISENINGSEPKIAILNQDNAVKRKAWGKLIFLSWSKFYRKKRIPNITVTIPELIKPESSSS